MLFFTKQGMNGFHIKTSPSSLSSTNLSKNSAVQVLVYTLLFQAFMPYFLPKTPRKQRTDLCLSDTTMMLLIWLHVGARNCYIHLMQELLLRQSRVKLIILMWKLFISDLLLKKFDERSSEAISVSNLGAVES